MKTFYSNYFASLFPGVALGIFFSMVLNQNNLPLWEKNPIKWIVYLIITFILIKSFYLIGLKIVIDKKERQNFHDGYLNGIITAFVTAMIILFSPWIRISIWHNLSALLILVLSYFLFNFLYLKFKYKGN